jgi:predicted ATPase
LKLDANTAGPIAQICHRLDGIPLALELAAARLAHFTVNELADRLGDALSLLGQRQRGRFDRQQTLAATLDWSHGLLDVQEQTTFRRLAVFSGGFDLEAAAAVCELRSQTVDSVVSRLVDKSLILAETSGPRTRYRLLEVVRQYAQVRLTEVAEVDESRRRHMEWYAALLLPTTRIMAAPLYVNRPAGLTWSTTTCVPHWLLPWQRIRQSLWR